MMSMGRRIMMMAGLGLLMAGFLVPARAAETYGTAEEAQHMVDRAAAFMKANGKDKLMAELNNAHGQFIDRDLYVLAYGLDGLRLAHPYNQKIVGLSVLDAVDFDGKAYGSEIVATAKTKGSGWVDYKYTDPTTKKLSDKSLYVLKVDDVILGCGIYKH